MAIDFRGIFDHGVIRPTEPVALPDGTEVECHVIIDATVDQTGTRATGSSWTSRSIEELAREQGITPIQSLEDLRGDFSDEPIEEFLDWLRQCRQ